MDDAPILICYDGSADSDRAIEAAAALLGPRRAVVVNIGPILTGAESVAALSSVVPGTAFEDMNMDSAMEKARAGVDRAREAGFEAEPRAELDGAVLAGHRRRGGRDRRGRDRDRLARLEGHPRAVRGKRLARGCRACRPPGVDRAAGAQALSIARGG